MLLINFSNHPSADWTKGQMEAAKEFGTVIDFPFPNISPDADERDIEIMALDYLQKLMDIARGHHVTFHIMGEMTFSFLLVRKLRELGYVCVASTSERIVEETVPGKKTVIFRFSRFRKYD